MAGRPKMPAGEAKTNVLRIRLTPAERKVLDGAAQAKGEETSTWARTLLLAMASERPRPKRA